MRTAAHICIYTYILTKKKYTQIFISVALIYIYWLIPKMFSCERNIQGFEHLQVWKMSFQEMENITNKFEEEIGKGAFGVVYKVRSSIAFSMLMKHFRYQNVF